MCTSGARWAIAFQPRPSLDEHEQRLAFLDDVGGELGRVAAADVAH